MKFKHHLLIGFTISYILVYFFNFQLISGAIIFLSSFLIDIDHYFWFSASMKDFNPLHAIKWYNQNIDKWHSLTPKEKNKFKTGVFILHSILLLLVIGIFASINKIILAVFLGMLIHLIADWCALIYYKEPLYTKIFPLPTIKRNKNKKSLRNL